MFYIKNRNTWDFVKIRKYPGACVSDERTKPKLVARIAQPTAAVAKLKTIWNYKGISLATKIRLVMATFL